MSQAMRGWFVKWVRLMGLAIGLVMLLKCWQFAPVAEPVAAQTARIAWSRPVNLSNSPESSGRPAIVSDRFGNVHVFWSEEVGGKSILNIPKALIRNGNTIFYTRWDGAAWTQPIDLLLVPGDDVAEYVAATVDKDNQIHLVWTGSTQFYYSTAPAWKAQSVHSWSAPVVVATGSARSQWESDIVADALGGIHIAYATGGSDAAIYQVASEDGGVTWDAPIKLSVPFDGLESSYSNVKIITDGAQRLHVIWQTNQDDGFGQSIYYARSVDRKNWAAPVLMAYRDPGEYGVTFPWIASVGESELHLIYVDGSWHIGRYHRISEDGGATWGQPAHVMQDFEGINGYPILLVDGANELYWVMTWRTRTQIGGTYYAHWLGTAWSPMELAVGEEPDWPGAHWTAATIRLGNEIHFVWNTNFSDKAGEIWHMSGAIPGVPQATPIPIPTATPKPMAPTVTRPVVAVATPAWQAIDSTAAPVLAASDMTVTLLAFVPMVVLVVGVMMWALLRPKS